MLRRIARIIKPGRAGILKKKINKKKDRKSLTLGVQMFSDSRAISARYHRCRRRVSREPPPPARGPTTCAGRPFEKTPSF